MGALLAQPALVGRRRRRGGAAATAAAAVAAVTHRVEFGRHLYIPGPLTWLCSCAIGPGGAVCGVRCAVCGVRCAVRGAVRASRWAGRGGEGNSFAQDNWCGE